MTYRPKAEATGSSPSKGKEPYFAPSGAPKPPKMVLGDELEYRIVRLQLFMGYMVRRGCPIFTIGGLDQATDLDVLAIRHIEPFRRQMLITECKGGEVGPLDRIFWLAGVKKFVGADEASLIRKTTKWNIKDFAKNAGVQIFDLPRVAELERRFRISATEWPTVSDRSFYAAHINDWNQTLFSNPNWWEFYWTVLSEVRYEEPFAAVNYLLQQLRLLTRSKGSSAPPASLERKLLADAISQLSLFLVQIAGLAFDLSEKDRKGFIVKGLKYGSLDSKFAERVLNSAYNLTRQAVLHYTHKNIDIDKELFQMPAPPGTEEVLAIIETIVNDYPASLTLPQISDLLLTEVFLKHQDGKKWLTRIFPYSDLASRLNVVKFYLQALIKAGACPEIVLESLDGCINSEKPSAIYEKAPPGPLKGEERLADSHSAIAQAMGSEEATSDQKPARDELFESYGEFKLEPPSK